MQRGPPIRTPAAPQPVVATVERDSSMSADDDATKLVLRVLSDPAIAGINFDLDAISVSPAIYREISQAIKDNKITVMVAPGRLESDESALYVPELKNPDGTVLYDVIILRTPELGSSIKEQVKRISAIVHECTHAGFAARKVPNMTVTL